MLYRACYNSPARCFGFVVLSMLGCAEYALPFIQCCTLCQRPLLAKARLLLQSFLDSTQALHAFLGNFLEEPGDYGKLSICPADLSKIWMKEARAGHNHQNPAAGETFPSLLPGTSRF